MSGREDQMTGRALLADAGDETKKSKKSGSRKEFKTEKKHKKAPTPSQNDTEDLRSKSSGTVRSSHLSRSTKYNKEVNYKTNLEKADYKRQIIDQIEELTEKKEKFKDKLIERKLQNEAAEKDVEILTKKVNDEIKDLNRANRKIDEQIRKIQILKQVMGRNVAYKKNIKRQQEFNNDLANDHKSNTLKMQK